VDNGFLMRLRVLSSFLHVFPLSCLSFLPFLLTYKEIIEVPECWNNGFNVTEAHLVRHKGSSLSTTIYRYLSEVYVPSSGTQTDN